MRSLLIVGLVFAALVIALAAALTPFVPPALHPLVTILIIALSLLIIGIIAVILCKQRAMLNAIVRDAEERGAADALGEVVRRASDLERSVPASAQYQLED